jgi:hypothetical protein
MTRPKHGIATALLTMHEQHGAILESFGFAKFAETDSVAYR